jgi:exopolyphosphatase/guanosine-5'-triphosphate,3'-diphosphate pyrophosphatase
MTERHLRDDPPTPARSPRPRRTSTPRSTGRSASCRAARARTVVGLAGSVTTVTALALGLDAYRPERIHHAG